MDLLRGNVRRPEDGRRDLRGVRGNVIQYGTIRTNFYVSLCVKIRLLRLDIPRSTQLRCGDIVQSRPSSCEEI